MNGILQGTTPTLVITIPEGIPVSTITAAELTFKHGDALTIHHLPDLDVDTEENSISYAFTEQETLALNPIAPLSWQLRIQTPDGIFGTVQQRISVLDLISQEVLE